jgi:hypothetical protein
MGIIRKAISGSLAAISGGASLGLVQFRSDTERGTRETKKLRKALTDSGQSGGVLNQSPSTSRHAPALFVPGTTASAITRSNNVNAQPLDLSVGWKTDPTDEGLERFWTGSAWTELQRDCGGTRP